MIRTLVLLIPLFPLLSCLITLVFGRALREKSHWPTVIACGLSWLCSITMLFLVNGAGHGETRHIYEWITIGGTYPLSIPIEFRADSLSCTMLSMLTFVSTLVALYASGYMHGERGYWRFFTEVSLFVFSMINLVLAANFLQLYVFWEAVGLCSYLLIGFWYEKPSAAAAGMKAFVVNRIGDFGFAIGVFLIWSTFGTLNFVEVFNAAKIAAQPPELIALICLCLFTGAVGKSAQFPLHVWLPDAMEGPTPVSALIHAATMVTAGVYMVARCTPLFMVAPDVQVIVAFIGGFTALLAALIALTQTDLKRVLAYSTVSQLGYMFLGLGTGLMAGVSGAMFHLVTHAFFKALLFLGAGSVMHAMGGVIDMRKFSGLKKVMPQTYLTFLIGSLALSGIFPFAGFWSKDAILSAAHSAGQGAVHAGADHGTEQVEPAGHAAGAADTAHKSEPHAVAGKRSHTGEPKRIMGMNHTTTYTLLYWSGILTALLTAFYTFRAFFMTFHGPERIPHEAGHHAHESPPVMCIPLWILAAGACVLGFVLDPHVTGLMDRYLNQTLPGIVHVGEAHAIDWFTMGLSTAVAFSGVGLAWVMYGSPSPLPAKMAKLFGPLTDLSRNKFYLDELYYAAIVMPLWGAAQLSRFIDWLIIDRLLIDGTSHIPALFAKLAKPMQNGLVQFYALSMMLAMAVLLVALLWGQG